MYLYLVFLICYASTEFTYDTTKKPFSLLCRFVNADFSPSESIAKSRLFFQNVLC